MRKTKGGARFCSRTVRCLEGRRIYEKHRHRALRRGSVDKEAIVKLALEELNGQYN